MIRDAPFPVPHGARLAGQVKVPASKSVTQRILNLALLSRAEVVLEDPLLSADTRAYFDVLPVLGLDVTSFPGGYRLSPSTLAQGARIDCGEGGTMLRFLTGTLTTIPGTWILGGSPRLCERPLGPLVGSLRQLGARIDYQDREGCAPLRIEGASLVGGRAEVDASRSSQFLSALIMAALRAERNTEIVVAGLISGPYVELTLEALDLFGADVKRSADHCFRIVPRPLRGGRFPVERDFSSACYFAAGAALTGGDVLLRGLRSASRQADRRFLDVLADMGAVVEWCEAGVKVSGNRGLQAVDVDLSALPDQVPTLAAIAPFARGTSRIRNVPHLRLKESDRLAAMAQGLRHLGAEVEELADGLVIPGCWADGGAPDHEVFVDSHNDHRIAMSLSLTGLRRPGTRILEPRVTAKSYPGFWDDLEALCGP